ncbi:MAG: methyltransferase domain-containing protein [Candidatus Falkowbacteria bacterium]|nr:methyltransferase domain-containing protein [Candidatus Falkowbacteria bacterium]
MSKLFDINLILNKIGITEGWQILEAGCGQFGHFVFPSAKLVGKQGRVFAADIIKSHLEEIERQKRTDNLPQITTIWTNLEVWQGTKISAGTLDAVLLVNTLNQTEKRNETLQELVRIIKRDGKLLIIEWKEHDLLFGPKTEKRINRENLKALAQKLGLKLIDEFEAGALHYALIFKKL